MIKRIFKVIGIILGIICLALLALYVNHKIQLSREKHLLKPLGELVEVDSRKMSIYTEGSGEQTIVFMSGSGTCSPILDFKSLYSLLSDKYRIVVVEKFGYGFSDITDTSRDIDTMLENTRTALSEAGIQYTVPIEAAVDQVRSGSEPELTTRQKHLRECYVVAEEGADKAAIEEAIKTMPNYFDEYDTTVTFITEEE